MNPDKQECFVGATCDFSTKKATLDAATGAKPAPLAFLAENYVTGIKRTNGT